MFLNEVQKTFFDYENKKHELITKTQQYFLQKKINPYVWIDEMHYLHIKIKEKRGVPFVDIHEKEYDDVILDFIKENNLNVFWKKLTCHTDYRLNKEIRHQWTIEYILRGEKDE